MGLHEIDVGGVFISPLLVYALIAFPITKGIMMLIYKTSLPRWIWHEVLFTFSLYFLIFTSLTLYMAVS